MSKWLLIAVLCFSSATLYAGEQPILRYSTGTGFFINREGDVLTNYHVIQRCSSYSVYGKTVSLQANLVAYDEDHDLALLKTDVPVDSFAAFNDQSLPLNAWDSIMVVGFPGNSWQTRKPVVGLAQIVDNKGPRGEDWQLQFSDSIAKGNSGGPLLDEAGNVVGVIRAKSSRSRIYHDTQAIEELEHADLAINLRTISTFLAEHDINYTQQNSYTPLSKATAERLAASYVVSVRCAAVK